MIGQLLDLQVMPHNEQLLLLIMILLKVIDDILKHDLLLRQLHLLHMMDVNDLIVQSDHLVLQFIVCCLELQTHYGYLVVLGLEEASHLHLLKLELLPRTHLVLGHGLEMLDLLVVERFFKERHFLRIHEVSMLLLFI